ncbi:MAG: imidazolonepropionase [Clostridia bacterium]|nr:imidazolonepropionase [Clostridia bacterium]
MERLILTNIAQLATCAGAAPKKGKDMSDIGISQFDCVLIEDGIIKEIGYTNDIVSRFASNEYTELDCKCNAVLPGFIDSHTHFVFAGHRQDEFAKRLNGISYMDILKQGGGIANTVNPTREASLDELVETGLKRADAMLEMGVTTLEGKSGYGLDRETEIKQLNALRQINETHPIDVVSTFMGAHLVPKEYANRADEYLEFLINKVMPEVKEKNLAEFTDIFCEEDVFDIEQSRRYLHIAKEMGFKIKIHADEIVDIGGAKLAAELGAVSADHLLKASKEGIKLMAEAGTIATLLPTTAYCLKDSFADARMIIDSGCPVALASDYNPGSSCTCSMPLLISLAALMMNMNTNEIITALTINAACALDRQNEVGSIEAGKKADIIILAYPSIDFLPYYAGINIVKTVIKNGKAIVKDRRTI